MNHLGQRGSNRNIRPSPLGSPARTTTYMAANSTHPTVTTRCEQIGIHRRSDTTTKSSVVKIIIGHVFLFFFFSSAVLYYPRLCVCVCDMIYQPYHFTRRRRRPPSGPTYRLHPHSDARLTRDVTSCLEKNVEKEKQFCSGGILLKNNKKKKST
jgi:hypothetical protein